MRIPFLALLVALFLLVQCDDSSDNNNNNNPTTPVTTKSPEFTPPAWTIGTWKDSYDIVSFEFRTDNIIMVSLQAGVSVNFKTGFSGAAVSEPVVSESEYTISATYPNMKQVYRFVKKTDTAIDYYLIMTDDAHSEDTVGQNPISLKKQ